MIKEKEKQSRCNARIRTPLKNHKNIGFRSNTGQVPLKNHKAAKVSIQCWAIKDSHAREMQLDEGPLIVVFGFSPTNRKGKKNVVEVGKKLDPL